MVFTIGIDPHKGSHVAAVPDEHETLLEEVRVSAGLNDKGNRQLNHALDLVAVTPISYDTAGRDYYQRKLPEKGNTKEAMRALKRRISDAVLHVAARRRVALNARRAREGTQGRLLNPAWPAEP